MTDQQITVEFTPEEAQAISHFLHGLGWGRFDAVRAIRSGRERLDQAIAVETQPAGKVHRSRKAA